MLLKHHKMYSTHFGNATNAPTKKKFKKVRQNPKKAKKRALTHSNIFNKS
jgi:hypothetical protein